ncbi:MAG: phosphotransferase [Acutalibacteraceae bacterium]|nr:phosphotransferase [Acutalibacteraceae bacterium]
MELGNIIAERPNKVIYQNGDSLIKVFGLDFSPADILNEALNQARVTESGIPMPKVRQVTRLEDGRWAIVMDFIAGKTLAQLMKENPEKEAEYLNKLVDLQMMINSKTASMLSSQKDKFNNKISLTKDYIPATVRYELHMRLEGMHRHNKLCHGDFCPSNVIVGDDGTDYIIDWSHATQGNASADVARTYLTFKLAGEDTRAEKYIDLYCQKSDTAKQYVQKWLPIVAASQIAKGKEEERQFLLGWINIFDFE